MWYKKKKVVLSITLIVGLCYMLYQLYFLSELTNERQLALSDNYKSDENGLYHESGETIQPKISVADKFISSQGNIKGVLISNMPMYKGDSNGIFKCLTSTQVIDIDQINDDYCDCDDQTDEPSTNACPNGIFYCDMQNRDKKLGPNFISSGRVNDGICDCCDGSDEWLFTRNATRMVLTQNHPTGRLLKHKRIYQLKCFDICKN